jgi:hypothetical protein
MQNSREAIKARLTILGESELTIVALPQMFYILYELERYTRWNIVIKLKYNRIIKS